MKVPKSTVSSIIRKWKEYGTTQTLPRAGCLTNLSNQTRRTLVKEVTKNPMTTLTELQSFLAEMGEPAGKRSLCSTSKSRLYGRVARWKLLLRKRQHAWSLQKHMKDSESIRQNTLWSNETKFELWPKCKALRLAETEHNSSPI